MWQPDKLRSDDGQVGAAAVCLHGNHWRSRRSLLSPGHVEVFDTRLWAIQLTLDVAIKKSETLQKHAVKMVAVFINSQAAIGFTAHLDPGPGQPLVRQISRSAWSLLAHGTATESHWVLGHSGIPGNNEADHLARLARDACGSTGLKQPYTSASNRAGRISEGRSAAEAKREANKCSKHFSYRLVLATGPGNLPAVRFLAGGSVRFGSKPGQ